MLDIPAAKVRMDLFEKVPQDKKWAGESTEPAETWEEEAFGFFRLPRKYAGGQTSIVRENNNSDYFQANLDAYGGNSGSAVINAETHEVEGILVRGSYDFDSAGECDISLVQPGAAVTVRLDAYPEQVWEGTVDKIRPAAELRQTDNVFIAEVVIRNENELLRPGMKWRREKEL